MRFWVNMAWGVGVLLLVTAAALIAEDDIAVRGDRIAYDRHKGVVEASGNASLSYKGRTVESEKLIYQFESKKVDFSKMFHVKHSNYDIVADEFVFDYESNTGKANNLRANLGRLFLSGKSVDISPEGVEMNDAIFTTCDEEHMHYSLASEVIYIYPTWGFMVAMNNWLEVPFLPFKFWVPSFVYGSQKYSILATPLPLFGSNRREGSYVKQEFNYFLSPVDSGVIGVGTSEKRGGFLGIVHQRLLDEKSMIQADVHYTQTDGVEGGVTHHWVLQKESLLSEGEEDPLLMFHREQPSTIRLMTEIKDGDFIEDSKVNKLPHIQLIGEDQSFPIWDLEGEWRLGWGQFEEDPFEGEDVESAMTAAKFELKKSFRVYGLNSQGTLLYDGYWYDAFDEWQRLFFNVSVGVPDWVFQPVFTLRKEVFERGRSPFEFQRTNAIIEDEIGIRLKAEYLGLEWLYEGDYTLDEFEPRQLRTQVGKTFHCWGIDVSWESIHRRFSFGVRLF